MVPTVISICIVFSFIEDSAVKMQHFTSNYNSNI